MDDTTNNCDDINKQFKGKSYLPYYCNYAFSDNQNIKCIWNHDNNNCETCQKN